MPFDWFGEMSAWGSEVWLFRCAFKMSCFFREEADCLRFEFVLMWDADPDDGEGMMPLLFVLLFERGWYSECPV